MSRHYSPIEWKLKNHFNADDICSIGWCSWFQGRVYLIEKDDKYQFVLYDRKEKCVYTFKENKVDGAEFRSIKKGERVK